MLRKLLKYDFKECGKLLLPIYAGLFLISLFGRFLLETDLYQSVPETILLLSMLTYILVIVACCFGVPIYFVIFFYRSFYTNKGYLIHTLPVSTHQKLCSKIITAFVMELLTIAICILSALMLWADPEDFSLLKRTIQSISPTFSIMVEMEFNTFLIITFIMLLISLLSKILMFFAAISIGQFFNSHKILGAIGAYLVLYFINQLLSVMILILLSFGIANTSLFPTSTSILALYGLSSCFTLLLCLAYYIICYFFMEKRLNLN